MKKGLFVFFVSLFVCMFAMAQEQANGTQEAPVPQVTADSSLPALELAYGAFVKFSDGIMAVSEYDAEKDAQVETAYTVNSDIKVVNAESIDKISAGSNIEVAYELVSGKKTAKTVTVEKAEPQQ